MPEQHAWMRVGGYKSVSNARITSLGGPAQQATELVPPPEMDQVRGCSSSVSMVWASVSLSCSLSGRVGCFPHDIPGNHTGAPPPAQRRVRVNRPSPGPECQLVVGHVCPALRRTIFCSPRLLLVASVRDQLRQSCDVLDSPAHHGSSTARSPRHWLGWETSRRRFLLSSTSRIGLSFITS